MDDKETPTRSPASGPSPTGTDCCIVGGGPAGMVLALLLVRQGVRVTVLEAHADLDREFRGDTIHPSVLEIFDEIGLSEPLHQLRHSKIYGPTLRAANSSFTPFDFRRLKIKYPYIMLVPQATFLDFLAKEAGKYPEFNLRLSAPVESLIEEDGSVRGVRYMSKDGQQEVRAPLTVGADGRFSTVRQRGGVQPIKTSPPMDILWFSLPHQPGDLASGRVLGGFGMGRMLAVFDRFDHWQVGYVFPKGLYQEIRAQGLDVLRRSVAALEPTLSEHVKALTDWRQISLLSVESSRCPVWHRPGLLLIGDAAHVMSPVGGVGINYAIQDAVATANLLGGRLRAGSISDDDLARVQRRREFPTRFIQTFQAFVQKRVIASVLSSTGTTEIPLAFRLLFAAPIIRDLPARLIALGIRSEHVRNPGRQSSGQKTGAAA